MIEYEEFEKYMLKLKDQIKKEENLDKALRDMSPDFGGYGSEMTYLVVELLQKLVHDTGWIDYYVYEADWGDRFQGDCAWDRNGNPIPLKTIKDLYNAIKNEWEEENVQEIQTE